MSEMNVVSIRTDHCRAICDEIGERLRFSYLRIQPELPPSLRKLLNRLREQDREDSPSIAPSLAELSRSATLDYEDHADPIPQDTAQKSSVR